MKLFATAAVNSASALDSADIPLDAPLIGARNDGQPEDEGSYSAQGLEIASLSDTAQVKVQRQTFSSGQSMHKIPLSDEVCAQTAGVTSILGNSNQGAETKGANTSNLKSMLNSEDLPISDANNLAPSSVCTVANPSNQAALMPGKKRKADPTLIQDLTLMGSDSGSRRSGLKKSRTRGFEADSKLSSATNTDIDTATNSRGKPSCVVVSCPPMTANILDGSTSAAAPPPPRQSIHKPFISDQAGLHGANLSRRQPYTSSAGTVRNNPAGDSLYTSNATVTSTGQPVTSPRRFKKLIPQPKQRHLRFPTHENGPALNTALQYLDVTAPHTPISLQRISLSLSLADRKQVNGWAVVLSGLSDAERSSCASVSKLVRYAGSFIGPP